MTELPRGWALTTVGEAMSVAYGKSLEQALRTDDGEYQYVGSGGRIAATDERLTFGETIVVGRKGTAGSVQRFPQGCWPSDTTFFIEVPDGLNAALIEHQLRSAQLAQHDRSTALPGLGRPDLEATSLVVPPLAEQERIVTTIEEAFSKLDAGEAGLRTVRQLLRRMRDAILTAAVTGRLVSQDPTDTPAAKLLAELGAAPVEGEDLPSGWALARTVDLLAEPLANGRSVRSQTGGFSVLRLTCLKEGTVDRRETKEGEWTADVAAPYLIRKGDFLVSRGNGSLALVGRGGLVVDDDPPVAYPDTLIRMRLAPTTLEPRLLAIWWNSAIVRRQLEGAARTTAGIYKVNQSMIESIVLPIPAWEEQARLASEIERQLSFVEACERAVDVGLARSAGLRRSVLKAAFEGRLVPQDSSDEPASVLLDRIRAEREVKPVANRRARQTA